MTKPYNFSELVFSVSDLYTASSGTSNIHNINLELPFIDDDGKYKPKSNLKGTIKLISTGNTIEAALQDMNVDVEVPCDKCLNPYAQKVQIAEVERTFFLSENDKEHEDDMFIDTKKLQLDANDLVRQEIILHFPIVLVCSVGCEGLPGYEIEEEEVEEKPLAALKDLWQAKRNEVSASRNNTDFNTN